MADKLKTEIGKAIYRVRKCTVEPVRLRRIKEVLGFRQFSLRGEQAAAGPPEADAWSAWRSI